MGLKTGNRSHHVAIALDICPPGWPEEMELILLARRAVDATLAELPPEVATAAAGEVSLLFTQDSAMHDLNRRWRGVDRPTNVLAFPYDGPSAQGSPRPLGDIVLARDTLMDEADRQGKTPTDHMTHLVVHGFLHLLGYDHGDDQSAGVMEALEVRILAAIGIADPYTDRDRT